MPFRLESEEKNCGAYGTSLQWFPFLKIMKQSKETGFPGWWECEPDSGRGKN